MPDQKLLDYIKEQLSKGSTIPEVRATLSTSGWKESDVDLAFKQLSKSISDDTLPPPPPPLNLDTPISMVTGKDKHPNKPPENSSLVKQSPAITVVASLAMLFLMYFIFPFILLITALVGQPSNYPDLGFTLHFYALLLIFLLILIFFVIFSICGSFWVVKNGKAKEILRAVLPLVILNFLLFIVLPFPLYVFLSVSRLVEGPIYLYLGISPLMFIIYNFKISRLVSPSIDRVRIKKHKKFLLIILCGYFILFLLTMLINKNGSEAGKTSQIETEQPQLTPKVLSVDERDYQRKNDLNSMQAFINTYKSQNGSFPQTLSQIVGQDYLPSLPMDPLTNSPYTYVPNQGRSDYQLCAAFESTTVKCINASTIAWDLK